MERYRDDADLAAELRALRPSLRPAFAAELDGRAAAGFPRRSPIDGSGLGRLVASLRAVEPRRLLLPAGATTLTALVIATAIVAAGELGSSRSTSRLNLGSSIARSDGRQVGNENFDGSLHINRQSRSGSGSAEAEFKQAGPSSSVASAGVGRSAHLIPLAAGVRHRQVERAAEIVLGTTPSEVHEVADRVLQTVHTYRGIVLRSSIHDVGEADSTFDLLIPSSKLSDALAGFSEAGEVLARSESTADVTARAIGLSERLQDAEATVKGLLGRLAAAESDSEREIVEAELRSARRRAAGLRSRLSSLQRHVRFSRVSLRIDSKPGAVMGDSAGGWGLSGALHDAGRILTIAAGVAIVGIAAIGPLALIALLAWLAHRAWVRRGRERALG